jgi:hypothetical protein
MLLLLLFFFTLTVFSFRLALFNTLVSSARNAHFGAKLRNLISCLPVFKVPNRRSRFDGVHIFKIGALASAKHEFSAISSKRRSRHDGVHILHVHDLRTSL